MNNRKGWDPDAVAPPSTGGVYDREASPPRSGWWLVLIAVVLIFIAVKVLGL